VSLSDVAVSAAEGRNVLSTTSSPEEQDAKTTAQKASAPINIKRLIIDIPPYFFMKV
jgi:hypothetical protein